MIIISLPLIAPRNETAMHSDGERWESAVFAGYDNYNCFTFFVPLANPVVNFQPISTTRSWVGLRHQYGISAQPRSQGFLSSSLEARLREPWQRGWLFAHVLVPQMSFRGDWKSVVASAFVFCFFNLCWDLRVSSLSGCGHGSEILTGQNKLRLGSV